MSDESELQRLRHVVEALRAHHQPEPHRRRVLVCSGCGWDYPCATVSILDSVAAAADAPQAADPSTGTASGLS